MNEVSFLITAFLAYLIGTFPTGYLIAKRAGVDITKAGSGNVGATNIARTLGKKAGVVTLIIDMFKGLLAVLLVRVIIVEELYVGVAAAAVVCGHCFSIPGYLKGGKGVATSLGALLGLHPLLALIGVGVFAAIYASTKIVSLSSIITALATPASSILLRFPDYTSFPAGVIGLVIVLRHKENIRRLIEGKEPRTAISASKSK